MKVTFLAWFFIILCGHAISNMVFEDTPTSQHEDFTLSEPVKHGQVHGPNGIRRLHGEDELKGNQEVFHSIKGQKGKGTYGGANIVHGPHTSRRNAAALTARPSFFVSPTMVCVSSALALIFFPILGLW